MSYIFKPKDVLMGNPYGEFLYAVVTIDVSDPEDTTLDLYRADSPEEVLALYIRDNSGAEPEEEGFDPVVAHIKECWETTILCTLLGEIN